MLNAAQILQMEHSFNCGTFAGASQPAPWRRSSPAFQPPSAPCSVNCTGRRPGRPGNGHGHRQSRDKAEEYVLDCLARKEKSWAWATASTAPSTPRQNPKPMAVELCQTKTAKPAGYTDRGGGGLPAHLPNRTRRFWGQRRVLQGRRVHSLGNPHPLFYRHVRHVPGIRLHRPLPEFSRHSRLIRPGQLCRPETRPSAASPPPEFDDKCPGRATAARTVHFAGYSAVLSGAGAARPAYGCSGAPRGRPRYTTPVPRHTARCPPARVIAGSRVQCVGAELQVSPRA